MAFQVFHSLKEWRDRVPADQRTVLTVGNFDGVHLGHQKILREAAKRAREAGALGMAVTFDPHPLRVLRPETAPALIATLAQRLAGIEQMGLDAALVLRFDSALSRLSPEEFVERILVNELHVSAVLVGLNFRFGHRQAGDVARLGRLGKGFGFTVDIIAAVVVRGAVISSTAIRQAVAEGRVEQAGRLLGRPFALTGEVRPGAGQGRRLVVPTLNLAYEQELLPAKGVYATETVVGGHLHRSAANVGLRPTFDGKQLTVESHLFDFSATITSGRMELRFWKRLREEKQFVSPDALRAQVHRDIARAREFFTRLDRRLPAADRRSAVEKVAPA
jgi:riboflavin kinase/FMN adenylyltransferase